MVCCIILLFFCFLFFLVMDFLLFLKEYFDPLLLLRCFSRCGLGGSGGRSNCSFCVYRNNVKVND